MTLLSPRLLASSVTEFRNRGEKLDSIGNLSRAISVL
jgi:hypothetical protein